MDLNDSSRKSHHKTAGGQRGKKAENKRKKSFVKPQDLDPSEARKRNPRAFAIQNVQKTERRLTRKETISEKRKHVPVVDRTPLEPPPYVIAIVGPPKVGKSTLLQVNIKLDFRPDRVSRKNTLVND